MARKQQQLYLLGGLYDGVYLPMHPHFDTPATSILVWSTQMEKWYAYEWGGDGGCGTIDVYKINDTRSLPTEHPKKATIYELRFEGIIGVEQAQERLKAERKPEDKDETDSGLTEEEIND